MIDGIETVADLEVCGLTPRAISMLDKLDYVYIHDLERLTRRELLAVKGVDLRMAEIVCIALENYRAGRVVKSVRQCVEFQPGSRRGRAQQC